MTTRERAANNAACRIADALVVGMPRDIIVHGAVNGTAVCGAVVHHIRRGVTYILYTARGTHPHVGNARLRLVFRLPRLLVPVQVLHHFRSHFGRVVLRGRRYCQFVGTVLSVLALS